MVARKKALLVCIQKYGDSDCVYEDLPGIYEDRDNIVKCLKRFGFKDITILDDEGKNLTDIEIIEKYTNMAESLQEGDQFVFYFAGHGQYYPDTSVFSSGEFIMKGILELPCGNLY